MLAGSTASGLTEAGFTSRVASTGTGLGGNIKAASTGTGLGGNIKAASTGTGLGGNIKAVFGVVSVSGTAIGFTSDSTFVFFMISVSTVIDDSGYSTAVTGTPP